MTFQEKVDTTRMSSSFYREVAAMVAEAIESLGAYERGSGESGAAEAFNTIKNAGCAFLDGDKLKPLIRDAVGIRHERELTNAAITAASFSMLTKAPASHNAPLHKALATLRTHTDRLLENAETSEAAVSQPTGPTKGHSIAFVSESRIDALRQLENTQLDPKKTDSTVRRDKSRIRQWLLHGHSSADPGRDGSCPPGLWFGIVRAVCRKLSQVDQAGDGELARVIAEDRGRTPAFSNASAGSYS